VVNQVARGPIETSISVDYYVEPSNEPNYRRILSWIADTTTNNFTPLRIETCGITGSGWIERYSIKSQVNAPAKATVSYILYDEMAGTNTTAVTGIFDQTETSGLVHGWSTSLLPNNLSDVLYSNFEYNCNLDWKPMFVMGNKRPIQMQLVGATESMAITRNISIPITFSGQPSNEYYNGITGIKADVLQVIWGETSNPLLFNISGSPVLNSDLSLSDNGYLSVRSSINKYY
jgi:hypothetical protein